MRAPPSAAAPMCHSPSVARTTESAMASPSPVPEAESEARWNRSKTASRWSGGMPGPESSTRRLTRPPAKRVETSTRPPSPANLHGVVEEDAGQPVDQVRITGDRARPFSGATHRQCDLPSRWPRRRTGPTHRSAISRDVGRVGGAVCGGLVVGPRQPQQVLDDLAQPVALLAHTGEDLAVLLGVAGPAECQAHLGLDHGDRGAQLVRGIGREFGLAPADRLRRGRGSEADDRGTTEDRDGQDHAEDQFGGQERRPDVGDVSQALAGDQQRASGA